jgi:hypothetical protein
VPCGRELLRRRRVSGRVAGCELLTSHSRR